MKKRGILATAICSALVLLTSCLGETTNSQRLSGMPGVVYTGDALSGYKTLVDIGSFPIYSATLDKGDLLPGDCVVTSFEVDYSSPENATANTQGYYNVSFSACEKIDKDNFRSLSLPTDTTMMLTGELPINNSVEGMYMHSYVRGHQFLWPSINLQKNQTAQMQLYVDMSKIEACDEEEGLNCYSMFLRAVEVNAPTDDDKTLTLMPCAFNVQAFIDRINYLEKAEDNDYYLIRVYFVKEFKDNKPVWDYKTLQMATVKD